MSVEARCDVARRRTGRRTRTGIARTDLRTRAPCGRNDWGCSMNLLPGLQIVLDELTQRFGRQIEHAHAPQPNELYLHAKLELAGALCSAFYKKHQGRLAGVFAEDARAEHNVFFVYYLYALDSVHGFVFVRVPIPQDRPAMTSLTTAVHAADW